MGVITGNWHLILLYIPQGYILKGRWVGFIFISLPPSLVYIFSFCYSTHQGDAAEYKITPCQYFSWAPFSSYKHSPKSHICFFFSKPTVFQLEWVWICSKNGRKWVELNGKKKNFHQLHIIIIISVSHRWIIWDQTPSCLSHRLHTKLHFRSAFIQMPVC